MAEGDLPSIELLESHHEFPGAYHFKVIGHDDDAFVARVLSAVRDELSIPVDPPFTLRQSAGGKYVALTLSPFVATPHQVLAVYRRVRTVEGLKVLW